MVDKPVIQLVVEEVEIKDIVSLAT